MFGGLSHLTSKPEIGRDEHSTYRMFRLDPLPEIGIDPRGCQINPGGNVLQQAPPTQRVQIRDLIQNQPDTEFAEIVLTQLGHFRKSFARTSPNPHAVRAPVNSFLSLLLKPLPLKKRSRF